MPQPIRVGPTLVINSDNLFHKDAYYRPGGDMVRVGGVGYTIDPAKWSEVATPRARSAQRSITSLALSTTDCGMATPSALAVFMLITSSNWVGWPTGRSPGAEPCATFLT